MRREVLIAVSHVGVEMAALRLWMGSEVAADASYELRSRHPGKVHRARVLLSRRWLRASVVNGLTPRRCPSQVFLLAIAKCDRLAGVPQMLLSYELLLEQNVKYRDMVRIASRLQRPTALYDAGAVICVTVWSVSLWSVSLLPLAARARGARGNARPDAEVGQREPHARGAHQ
jgi:hypothetical protein